MSPTMTEGGIASWKLKEGDTFTAGDVLVEIETDKATIDVEAQDDGFLAKIVVSPRSSEARAIREKMWKAGGRERACCGSSGRAKRERLEGMMNRSSGA
jgi:hypothetical protein